MKTTSLTLLLSSIGISMCHAQKSLYIKGDILTPGFQIEYNFNPRHSLSLSNNLLFSAGFMGEDFKVNWTNTAQLQYRYYYNLNSRMAKGLSVANNNGSYFFASIKSYSDPTLWGSENASLMLMPTVGWGFQRFIKNTNWYYGANVGIGFPIQNNKISISPMMELKFGYLLHSQKFNKKTPREISFEKEEIR